MSTRVFRYPSFNKVTNTLIVFLICAVVALCIYGKKLLMIEFLYVWGGLAAIFVIPMSIIIFAAGHVVTFDQQNRIIIVRRWVYRSEHPFSQMQILKVKEVMPHGHYEIHMILSILGLAEKTGALYQLVASDPTDFNKKFILCESVFEKKIDKVKSELSEMMK